jgi:hypothetical protein
MRGIKAHRPGALARFHCLHDLELSRGRLAGNNQGGVAAAREGLSTVELRCVDTQASVTPASEP